MAKKYRTANGRSPKFNRELQRDMFKEGQKEGAKTGVFATKRDAKKYGGDW